MLAIIGPNWLDAQDADGQRRLDDPDDWVRLEIVRALARKITIIPLTVGGAVLPKKNELPEEMRPLLDRHAVAITTNGFRSEMAGLLKDIQAIRGPPSWWPRIGAGLATVTLIGVIIGGIYKLITIDQPVGAETWSQEVGGSGGNPFGPLTCGMGEALVGLYGRSGSGEDLRVFAIGPICAAARFRRVDKIQLLSIGAAHRRDDVGSLDGELFEVACPSNMIVIGSELAFTNFSPGNNAYLIKPLSLKCSSILSVDNASVKSVSLPGERLLYATRQSFSCPDGSAAFAIRGRAGQWIDALSIGCRHV
jgi:hypothetical protein